MSGMNQSSANKNLFAISFILYLVLTYLILLKQKEPTKDILLKGLFTLKLLCNPVASCSLINFDFLLSHTAQVEKRITLPFFYLYNFWIFTFYIYFMLQTIR